MDINQRIAQFENMAQADPDNDMAHFSLGGAYAQADRHEDAAASFLRCVELNPAMSKAWQMAAASLLRAGDRERAAEVAERGYRQAASRGDRLPQQGLAEVLGQLGKPIPQVEQSGSDTVGEGSGAFVCQRTGRPGRQLPKPPFKGPVGQWIYENISAQTWRDWIGQGTKVINELRLDFSREEDQATYDQHMHEYLGIDDDLHRRLNGDSSS